MSALRLIDTGLMSARRNIALSAATAELHCAGQVPDTLRLCLYPRSVLVGRTQSLADAVNLGACRRMGVEIARRITGGASFYMTPGVLAWELIAERHRFGRRPGEISERVCAGVAAALARFGLPAQVRPPDGIEINGRKVSASSAALHGPSVVIQGTVLVDVDFAELRAALRLPPPRAAHQSATECLTTVSEWLGRIPAMDELRGLLSAAIADSWRRDVYAGAVTPAELSLAHRLFNDSMGTDVFTVLGDAGARGLAAAGALVR
jgi:lipoate-protein ligase A